MSDFSVTNSLYGSYEKLSSGSKINSAADDAAGLAITEKLESQKNSYDVGADNAATSQDMTDVAEGALSSITDALQRMKELSLQAKNAFYGDGEKKAIQTEIDRLKSSISDIAANTQFNTLNLLDGSMGESNVVTNPDGSGSVIDMPVATLESLGLADYDVTGEFDMSAIDKALEKVTMARSELGATSNGLDYAINYNSYASYNLTAAKSSKADTDFAEEISELKKNQILNEYQLMMQKKKEEEEEGVVRLLKF